MDPVGEGLGVFVQKQNASDTAIHDAEDIVEGNLKDGIKIPQPADRCGNATQGEKVTIGLVVMPFKVLGRLVEVGLTGRFDGSSVWRDGFALDYSARRRCCAWVGPC